MLHNHSTHSPLDFTAQALTCLTGVVKVGSGAGGVLLDPALGTAFLTFVSEM